MLEENGDHESVPSRYPPAFEETTATDPIRRSIVTLSDPRVVAIKPSAVSTIESARVDASQQYPPFAVGGGGAPAAPGSATRPSAETVFRPSFKTTLHPSSPIAPGMKFIDGEPMNPATNRLAG